MSSPRAARVAAHAGKENEMAIGVILYPPREVPRDVLLDVCVRLQRLGFCATVGHDGPFGSISVNGSLDPVQTAMNAEITLERVK